MLIEPTQSNVSPPFKVKWTTDQQKAWQVDLEISPTSSISTGTKYDTTTREITIPSSYLPNVPEGKCTLKVLVLKESGDPEIFSKDIKIGAGEPPTNGKPSIDPKILIALVLGILALLYLWRR